MWQRLLRSVHAFIEVGLLFLPGIPAYIWLWPNVENTDWFMPVHYALILLVPIYLWKIYHANIYVGRPI